MVDAFVEKTLEDALVNPEYAKWNVSSIAAMYAAAIGCNGDRAKELGNTILDNYLTWTQSQGPNCPLAQYVADVIKSKDRALASGIKYQMGPYWTIIPEPNFPSPPNCL